MDPNEQAVVIQFNYGRQDLDLLHELEESLKAVLETAAVGEYDGHDLVADNSSGTLYLYGPNAEHVFSAIESTLKNCEFMRGAIAKLRLGPPEDGVKELQFEL